MELEDIKNQLVKWVGELRYAGYKEEDCIYVDEEKGRVYMRLYTDGHSYGISARPPRTGKEKDNGYLGCIATSRKPRAGEDWNRGNDLADGPFGHETWLKILGDIVGFELVKIQRPLFYRHKPELEDRGTVEEKASTPFEL